MSKAFSYRQIVSVQRSPRSDWEPAEYQRPCTDWKGYHEVLLPLGAERRIDSMTGAECNDQNPHSFITRTLFVPSVRIRNQVP